MIGRSELIAEMKQRRMVRRTKAFSEPLRHNGAVSILGGGLVAALLAFSGHIH